MTTLDSGDLSCFGRPIFSIIWNITAVAFPVFSFAAKKRLLNGSLSSVRTLKYFMKVFYKIKYSPILPMRTSFPLCILISAATVL